jgi:hypothetical protein
MEAPVVRRDSNKLGILIFRLWLTTSVRLFVILAWLDWSQKMRRW